MTTYKDRYVQVFESGRTRNESSSEKIKLLAQLIYANDRAQDKEDCLVQALEEFELMTGRFRDPTLNEWSDMLAAII